MNLRQNVLEWGLNLGIIGLLVYGHVLRFSEFGGVWIGLLYGVPIAFLLAGIYWVFRRKNFLKITFRFFRIISLMIILILLWQTQKTIEIQGRIRDFSGYYPTGK